MKTQNAIHRIQQVRHLTPSAFILRIDRGRLQFQPGQYINLGMPGHVATREYSIYSGVDDDYLEVLIKEVKDGFVSSQLKKLSEGDAINVEGPFGFFRIKGRDTGKNFLFIASGTGISPFHSMVKSLPEIDYRLLHGVGNVGDSYETETYQPNRIVRCISREEGGDYSGRVTGYLKKIDMVPGTLCYLCGNSEMIFDAFDILTARGIPPENIFTEVYF